MNIIHTKFYTLFICEQVSAAKYARAERELKATRPLGEGTKKFYECADVGSDASTDAQKLYVAITSDRGTKS